MRRSLALVLSLLVLSLAASASAQTPILGPSAPAGAAYVPVSGPTYGGPGAPAARDRYGRSLVGFRTERRTDSGLWGAGLGLFLAGWVLDFALLTPIANAISEDRTGANEEDAWAWSLLPIVGPMVQLGIGAPHPAIPITCGLVQITGLVLFVFGLTQERDVEVPVYAFGDPEDPGTARITMNVASMGDGAYATVSLHAF